MDPLVKVMLGFKPDTDDAHVRAEWDRRTASVCKPCWELKYCPYGPLVEMFPHPDSPRAEMVAHDEMLKQQLREGIDDPARRSEVEEMVDRFDPDDYPEQADTTNEERVCTVFGHFCPVFFANEPLTETGELRRSTRHIPRPVMLRVVRRDNNQCQMCGKILRDDEIEFDHVIPLSKGGSSEEHNLRVACSDCNRSKSAKFEP